MKRWSLGGSLLDTRDERNRFQLSVQNMGSSEFVLGTPPVETSDSVQIPESILIRLACHALVHRLPTEALPETIESLVELQEFYAARKQPALSIPSSSSRPASWGETIVRPVFPITEDE